jgi:hypothetical protein
MQGIESDDGPLHGNGIKQLFDHGDFIGSRGYLRLGHNGCFLMQKCCEKVHLPPVPTAGSLEGFAVYCHGDTGTHNGFTPAGNGRVYGLTVEGLKEATDGRFTGRFIEIGSWFLSASQSLEHFLGAGFCPLGYGVEALGSADDGTDGNGKNSQSVVTDAPRHARVRDGEQGFVKQMRVVFREFHGSKPWFERWFDAWIGELPESVSPKGPDKDGFDAPVMGVDVAVLGKASGVPEKGPPGSTVAGALIQIRIDECLSEPDGMPVGALPIIGQALEVEGKNA